MDPQGPRDQVSDRQFTHDKKRILSVDDEPAILYTRELLLQSEGYEVLSAPDGERALNIFDAERMTSSCWIT
jgi:CheY-like chemotaxis protein